METLLEQLSSHESDKEFWRVWTHGKVGKQKPERLQLLDVGYQSVNLTSGEKGSELAVMEDRVQLFHLIKMTGPDFHGTH